jgi:hypothetical protein
MKRNFTDDNYEITISNDYTDININQPNPKLNCQRQVTFLSVFYMDESDG